MTNDQAFLMLTLFERTPDLVCIVDKPGRFITVNPAVVKTLGYSKEELFSRPVSVLIHPDDREITAAQRSRLLDNEPLINFQNRYIAKDGSIVWLQWTSVYIPEREIVFAIARDITIKKQSEIEIEANFKKYKELAAHFKHHVEKDRHFFASELHEELAQLATVIKMDFEWLTVQQPSADEISKKRMESGLAAAKTLIDRIRKLSYSINPAQIEDIGLDSVIRSLCSEFYRLTGIRCNYKSSFKEKALDHETKLDLFRICQEALLNVMHHAQATEVIILLRENKKKIELSIEV